MADDRETPIDGESVPVLPPRYWWLKRIAIGVVVLIIALVGLRWWWGVVAERRLQAEIDQCRAAGEPIFPEDFNPTPVPDDQNAVLVLDECVIVMAPPVSDELGQMARQPHHVPYRLDDAKALFRASVHARALAREARRRPDADWGLRARQPAERVVNDLRMHRRLARALCVAAVYEHRTGDHASAIETIRDALGVARVVDAHPTSVAHQLARAVFCSAAMAVEAVAPDLVVARAGDKDSGSAARADPKQVRALITELLDEEAFRRSASRVHRLVLMKQLANWGVIAGGKISYSRFAVGSSVQPGLSEQAANVLYRPTVFLDAARMLRAYSLLADTKGPLDWPAAKATLPAKPGTATRLEQFLRPLSSGRPEVLDELVEAELLTLAMRRMAAVALAIRMYRWDRNQFPEALGDLAPDYLPRVPTDPFAPGRQELRYSSGPVNWYLYSVGPDGVDGGGTAELSERPPHLLDVLFTLEREGRRQPFVWSAVSPLSRRGGPKSGW